MLLLVAGSSMVFSQAVVKYTTTESAIWQKSKVKFGSVEESPHIYFELLPKKFTITQFRTLSQVIQNITYDVRNFSKRTLALPYIKRLDERETNVAHRAAYLYRFDKGEYKKLRK